MSENLLPKLSGTEARVYLALLQLQLENKKGFSIFRNKISERCGVCQKRISMAMVRLRRFGIIKYRLIEIKKHDINGRFVNNSYRTYYEDISVSTVLINRQDATSRRSEDPPTVGTSRLDGPSGRNVETVNRQDATSRRFSQMKEPSRRDGETVNRLDATASPFSKEKETEHPVSDFREEFENEVEKISQPCRQKPAASAVRGNGCEQLQPFDETGNAFSNLKDKISTETKEEMLFRIREVLKRNCSSSTSGKNGSAH